MHFSSANENPVSLPALVVLVVLLVVAVHGELKERRIPNWLTLSGMGLGLALSGFQGAAAFWSSAGGLAIGFGFLFVFYVFGGVGGGDVKLMGAVGALLGSGLIQPALFCTAFVGAFLAVMMIIWRKGSWERLGWSVRRLAFWRSSPETAPLAQAPVTVPYGMAIATGVLLALLIHQAN
jgi:prepilin peptidase CpaA